MMKVIPLKNPTIFTRFRKDLIQNSSFYLMLSPGVILLIVFHYLPMAGVLIAFKRFTYGGHGFLNSFLNSKWVGLDNFKFFIQTPDAFNITRNTVLYNFTFIFLGLAIPVITAIALNEIRNVKLAKFYQSAIFLPYFLSWIVVSYLLFSFLNSDFGIMNRVVLKALGIEGISWYSTTNVWPFIFTFLNVWKYAGYGCVIYFATIAGIDAEYYEAAAIDGASRWQRITKITLPFLKPVMIITTILAIGRIFNADFGLFYQASLGLGNGALKPVGDVIDTYVYQALINTGDIGMSAAAGLYQAVIGFILVLSSNYIVRKISNENSLF
jgi:putative aldouronate transport system permease protein